MRDDSDSSAPRAVYCMHCGTEGVRGDYACVRCGERLYIPNPEQPPPLGHVGCGNCGAANEASASYCATCQARLDDTPRVSPNAQTGLGDETPSSVNGSPVSGGRRGPTREPVEEAAGVSMADSDGADRAIPGRSRPPAVDETPLPDGVRGWNWAAFILGPVWGIGLRIWWTAIAFLVIAVMLRTSWQLALVAWIALAMFLGLRGNEFAWRAQRWDSVGQFIATQQRWSIGALVTLAAVVVGVAIVLIVSL